MKVIVLSSGSKGNTTYIETKKSKILIDAGNSTKYIVNKLNEINVNIEDIDALLITHTHSDHIKGIKTLIKKSNLTVYISDLMHKELDYVNNYQIIDKENFTIKDCEIEIIKTSHDTTIIGCSGYKPKHPILTQRHKTGELYERKRTEPCGSDIFGAWKRRSKISGK